MKRYRVVTNKIKGLKRSDVLVLNEQARREPFYYYAKGKPVRIKQCIVENNHNWFRKLDTQTITVEEPRF